ncbi:MAG: HDOD domain-containing protein [Rhodocyclales bacterium]|nr:HDOD domain-containing protein [Rhodocyclales bacterium]
MKPDTDQDQLREVFVGRQPILDRHQAVIGYELQFNDTRGSAQGSLAIATANMVCKAFSELGLADAFGHALTFIRVNAEFLAADFIELLPPETVVLEVSLADFHQEGTLHRCRLLKERGYRFCLTGTTEIAEGVWPTVELAEWIKVDLATVPPSNLQTVTRTLATARRKLIAAGVDTQAQQEVCRMLGFELLQGYAFAEPAVIEGRKLDASIQGLLRISRLLAEEADLVSLDAAFRTEPALVINLLRIANSVGSGMRTRVTSIRNAITAVGTKQLQRWLHLLIFAQGGNLDVARNPLLQLAALRGRYMESLAERLHPELKRLREPAFLTGLMSVVPTALHMSMTDVLANIALDQEVRLALSHRQGVLGNLLDILECYDRNDVGAVQERLAPFGDKAPVAIMGIMLAEAIHWVQQLGTEAG